MSLNEKNTAMIGDAVLSSLTAGLWAFIFIFLTVGGNGRAFVTGLVFGGIVAFLWLAAAGDDFENESTN